MPQHGLPALLVSLRSSTPVRVSGVECELRFAPGHSPLSTSTGESRRARLDGRRVVRRSSRSRGCAPGLLRRAHTLQNGPGDAGGGRPDPLCQRACLPPCSRAPSICSRLEVRPALIRVPKPYDPPCPYPLPSRPGRDSRRRARGPADLLQHTSSAGAEVFQRAPATPRPRTSRRRAPPAPPPRRHPPAPARRIPAERGHPAGSPRNRAGCAPGA